MKDKEWAKCIVRKELESWQNIEGGIDEEGIKYVLNIIDQLYEPEVLSQELPVLPKFMSNWIEENRQRYKNTFFSIGYDLYDNAIHPAVDEWIIGNEEKFVRAWFNAYKIEEEPLYYALIKGHELLKGKSDWVVPTYWCLDTTNGNMFISDRITVRDKFLIEASKSEWNKLGINDSNADFIKVEVAE